MEMFTEAHLAEYTAQLLCNHRSCGCTAPCGYCRSGGAYFAAHIFDIDPARMLWRDYMLISRQIGLAFVAAYGRVPTGRLN